MLSLPCCLWALVAVEQGLLFSGCGARASWCSGFSCCGAWALEMQASDACGVFLDQRWNRVPCIDRWVPKPWTMREVPLHILILCSYHLYCCSDGTTWAIVASSGWLPCNKPLPFLSTSLLSDVTRYSTVILCFPFPSSRISDFSKEPGFPLETRFWCWAAMVSLLLVPLPAQG